MTRENKGKHRTSGESAGRIKVQEKEMRKKRRRSWMLAGMLAVSGIAGGVFQAGIFPAAGGMIVQAEETPSAKSGEYITRGGTAVMGTGSASITVRGNEGQSLVGKQFYVYKLFFAENSRDGESINYTFNPLYEQALRNVTARALSRDGKQVKAADVTEYMVIDYIQTLNTSPVEGARTPQQEEGRYSLFRYFVEDVRDEIVSLKIQPDIVSVRDVQAGNVIRMTGLDYGYYIIDEVSWVEGTHSAASLCMVNTANPTAEIAVKSDYPSIIKKIQEDDEEDKIRDAENWNDIADFEIGQDVPYKFVSDIPDMNGYDTYYYAWHDVMDEALTLQPGSIKIEISGKIGNAKKSYTLKKGEYTLVTNPADGKDTFQVVVADIKEITDREFNQIDQNGHNIYGQSVTLRFDATLNERAVNKTGRPGFENDVRLEFSNDADGDGSGKTGYTPWDTVVCFTYKLDVEKLNDHGKTLAGAKFRLYSDEDCKNEVYVKKVSNGYAVINRDLTGGEDHTGGEKPAQAEEMVSGEDGLFTIYGLDRGTYYLKETDAPDGYRPLLDPIELSVNPVYTDDRDNYIKGEGAAETTLQRLDVSAHIESFYDGLAQEEDQNLETDVENGSANLTVINNVGKKLPVTGTHTVLLLFIAGAGLMTVTVIKSRKRKEPEGDTDR